MGDGRPARQGRGRPTGQPTRRTVLTGALAAVTAAGLASCRTAGAGLAPVQDGRLSTAHWRGGSPRWFLALPEGASATVIALHGHGSEARWWFDPPLAQSQAQRLGLAIAAVDGAGTYWHERADGTDTGSMVLEDLLPVLEQAGAPVERVGFTGFSMGGYGALLLATRLPTERVLGVAAVSSALFLDAAETAPGAFDDADDFARHDVLADPAVTALRALPIWLACGEEDTFAEPNHALAARLPDAETTFGPGGHDRAYLEAHWPQGLEFLAEQV